MKGKLVCILVSVLLTIDLAYSQGKLDFLEIEGTAVDIYTPPNYSQDKNYPVVYFNDGQMLFGHPSIGMALQVTLDSLIQNNLIQELIVVGIAADRMRTEKYVPYQDDSFKRMPDGGTYAAYYADLIVNKIVPLIDEKYKTIQKSEGRAIFGFSFGGLNSLWMMFNYPDFFSMAAGFSASFWVNDFEMFNEAPKYQMGQKIWFDIGTAEWNYYVPFQKLLKDNSAKVNEDVFYLEVPHAAHTSTDWQKRMAMPFLIFAGTKPHTITKMEVEIEIIPSQSTPGKKFTRLNPVVTCKDGLKYSLAYEAKYEVINPEAGRVYEEGRFELYGSENLEVLVTYKEFSKKVKIKAKLLN
ncbi:Predicted hydrolase of the alpha/beta superfamily [Reichenbachiella faecimaris]|uniref:Predicted hydrolase of the alpha/beta superfamily n=1 Tax=Reichenbachiella faecimaris TaxID=692418 RepID=A0A1W2G5J4_REIFA|nr:alpha/beta hydrolase-fold protein [Reichenbachiella faecimaris]SMD31940.1 Predicted hydrolase of the alpha/beta superfamily [Reichenbachiella faecimaris]